jgi:hypothetical protein
LSKNLQNIHNILNLAHFFLLKHSVSSPADLPEWRRASRFLAAWESARAATTVSPPCKYQQVIITINHFSAIDNSHEYPNRIHEIISNNQTSY